jgi:large subunit ribosomal protein L1
MLKGKKYKQSLSSYDPLEEYGLDKAIDLLHNFSKSNFDESVDIYVNLGVDPRHADQLVRGMVSLPNGTGKKIKVVVLSKDDGKNKKAKDLGALESGSKDLLDKISKGWLDFDVLIASPDMMAEVGKLGRVLGPRGLMPNPKTGTVTPDIEKAVEEIIAGKVEYRVDKAGIIAVSVGRISFDKDKIIENINACIGAILKAKPSSVKGIYFKKFSISSTMSPSLKIDKSEFIN